MKKRVLFLIAVLALAGASFVPSVSALTWTVAFTDQYDATVTGSPNQGGYATNGETAVYGVDDQDLSQLFIYRCVQGNAPLCVRNSQPEAGGEFEFTTHGTNGFAYCAPNAANTALVFYTSSNGGLSWASSTAHSTDGVNGCGVAQVGSTVWVAGVNGTANDIRMSRSTNGGATWSTFYLSQTGANVASATPRISIGGNATHLVLTYRNTGGDLGRCYTTTGGVNTEAWTCNTDPFVTSNTHNHMVFTGGKWRGIGSFGTTMRYYEFATVDGLATISTISTGEGAGTFNHHLMGYDATTVVATWLDPTNDIGRIGISTDSGASFTTETAMTPGEAFDTNGGVSGAFGADGVYYGCYAFTETASDDGEFVCTTAGVATVIGASATVSVTGLVGFDVDPTGSIAIARVTSGEDVLVYNAQNLVASSGTIDTNCAAGSNDVEDGVMAKHASSGSSLKLVGYLDCDVNGDSEFFSIRTTAGEVPTFEGCSTCGEDTDTSDYDNPVDSGLGQLGQVKDFPIDYSDRTTVGLQGTRHYAVSFATQQCDSPPGPSFCSGTEPGFVGVFTRTELSEDTPEGENERQATVEHHPTQDVRQFCLGLDTASDTYYLGSVVDGQPGHTWSVTFSHSGVQTGGQTLDVTISGDPSSFGTGGGAIACGGGQILTLNGGDSTIQLLTRGGAFVETTSPIDGIVRGVSISEEFKGPQAAVAQRGDNCDSALEGTGFCLQYGVYVDDATDEGVIVNLTGGAIDEVGRITLPSGTFHSIRMDRLAQDVWVATSTTIARFHVTNVTTGVPVNTPGDVIGDEPSDGDGLFGNQGQVIGDAFGVGAFGGNLFMGIVLIALCAYGVGTGYGNLVDSNTMQTRALRVNPWAAAVGAVLGFVMAWAFDFFTAGAVFAVVVLAALVVGARFWFGSRG